MVQVLLVGDGESGKTTFLGLLYATQVKSGSGPADEFRFHASPESLEKIAPVFQELMSGTFPEAVAKEGIKELSFQIRPRGKAGFLRARRAEGASATVRFTVLRKKVEDVAHLLMQSSVIDRAADAIYGSDVVVILVDGGKLGLEDGTGASALSGYDAGVEGLLTMIQRLSDPRARRPLHPVFVFTKFDRVRPEDLRALGLGATPPGVGESRARATYGERILGQRLPKTLARVRARSEGDLKFSDPAYFFSWVRIEEREPDQPERIRLRSNGGAGWEPDYPYVEYRAFMEHLAGVAGRGGD